MSFKAVIIGLIICIAIISPAYAGSNGIIILDEEQQAAQNTQEYLNCSMGYLPISLKQEDNLNSGLPITKPRTSH